MQYCIHHVTVVVLRVRAREMEPLNRSVTLRVDEWTRARVVGPFGSIYTFKNTDNVPVFNIHNTIVPEFKQ